METRLHIMVDNGPATIRGGESLHCFATALHMWIRCLGMTTSDHIGCSITFMDTSQMLNSCFNSLITIQIKSGQKYWQM